MAPRPFSSMVRTHNLRTRNHRLRDFPLHYKAEIFAPLRHHQDQSPDLVFFDRSQGAMATFGYPLSATTQEPISPHGILSYLERRHIGWECNCGIVSEFPCILDMHVTRHGVVGSCHTCGTYVDFNKIYNTFTKGSPYEGHGRHSAIQPAFAPTITIARRALDFSRNGTNHYIRATGSTNIRRRRQFRQFRQVTPFQSRSDSPSSGSFSPPSPTELLRNKNPNGKASGRSPSRFMSLNSPTSSQASNLMGNGNVAAGSSSSSAGPDSPLQFCDTCFAAYPIQDFPTHACTN